MNFKYTNLNNLTNLIEGVVVRKLTVHTDATGSLVETMRDSWEDVIGEKMPFKMQYISQTPPGLARDENEWHVHKNQKDRFACISGRIVTAIYDPREGSLTKGELNLFVMGPQKEEEMYLLVIPERTLHGFMTISKTPALLSNFPTQIYNPEDEGRIPHQKEISWSKVREDFGI